MKIYDSNASSDHQAYVLLDPKSFMKFDVDVLIYFRYTIGGILFSWIIFVFYRFVERFMSRQESLEVLGDKMRKFNNVYVKNLCEEIDDEKLRDMFEPYGKIISAKV